MCGCVTLGFLFYLVTFEKSELGLRDTDLILGQLLDGLREAEKNGQQGRMEQRGADTGDSVISSERQELRE